MLNLINIFFYKEFYLQKRHFSIFPAKKFNWKFEIMLMKDYYSKWQSANNSIYADFITVNATSFHWKIFCFFFLLGVFGGCSEEGVPTGRSTQTFQLAFCCSSVPTHSQLNRLSRVHAKLHLSCFSIIYE